MYNLAIVLPILFVVLLLMFLFLGSRLFDSRERKQSKNIVDDIFQSSPYRKQDLQPIRPHNDPLARNKVYEKRKQEEMEMGVVPYDPTNSLQQEDQRDNVKIVGLVEPKGFWSRFIMGQKMGYIMARLNFQKNSNKGFWVNLINAQAQSQGKDQSRGR